MLAIILKDLRIYANTRKYLIVQFVVISVLILVLFIGTMEFYAQGIDTNKIGSLIDVGKQTYIILILCIFFAQFVVPRHAVDAICLEHIGNNFKDNLPSDNSNWTFLRLTPIGNWRIIGGKLTAVVVWSFWLIWFSIPLFALSGFLGGVTIGQYLQSSVVIFASCLLYALIGIGFALWLSPLNAKGISYGIVLMTTFLPLLPISPFTEIPMIEILSPLAALLSILQSDAGLMWMWHVGLYCVLCLVLFPVVVWGMSRIEV